MDIFEKGQQISLLFRKDDNMVEMACTIDNVYDDRLEIALPSYFMRYIAYLQVGCPLTARAFSSSSTLDFNSIVISSPLEERFLIELDYNALNLNKNDADISVEAMVNLTLNCDNTNLALKTFELSTEHIKFYSQTPLEIGKMYAGSLDLTKDVGNVNLKITIKEIDEIYDTEYTAEITTMSQKDRQLLMYYMYLYTKKAI